MTEQLDLKTESEHKLEKPKKYGIVFLNDDYTPMDFVVAVLMKIFNHPSDIAHCLMLEIHECGKVTVGIFPKDIAATKINQVNTLAQENEHPLKAVMEPVD